MNNRPPFSSHVLSALTPVGGTSPEGSTQTAGVSPTSQGIGIVITNNDILARLDALIEINTQIRDLLLQFK